MLLIGLSSLLNGTVEYVQICEANKQEGLFGGDIWMS
jgi:hypothetical protein